MVEFFPEAAVFVQAGPLAIRWYALAYLAGIALGWTYARYLVRGWGPGAPSAQDVDDFIPWAIVGIIAGGRLGYVLFYGPAYFAAHPWEALAIWQGGMSFHGGFLGVAVATVAYARARGLALLSLADVVACVAPIGLLLGRVANFVNGELYGRHTDAPWGMVFEAGGPLARHPSQLYEAALEGALLFAVLFALSRVAWVRARPGALAGAFLVGYGAARCLVELFREPDAPLVVGTLTMGQALSAPMLLLGAGLILHAWRRGR